VGVACGEAAAAVAVEVLAVGVVTDDDDGAGMRVDECVSMLMTHFCPSVFNGLME